MKAVYVISGIIALILVALCYILFSNSLTSTTNNQNANEISLNFNQVVALENTSLNVKFVDVVQDSRCPTSVTCVQAGDVSLSFNIFEDKFNLGNVNLTIGAENAKIISKYRIELLSVSPYPRTPGKINNSEYKANLKISEVYT